MDKVTKVSISGISFTLEENAYSILKDYLSRLNSHYETYPNGQEIVEGIEERIAELLIDAGGKSGIVSQLMIQKVLDTVGRPEEIYEDSEASQSRTSPSDGQDAPQKRLYRNPNDRVIAGVCGGLGAYFHKDPLWFRLGFVLLAAIPAFTNHNWNGWWNPFTFILLYFILCICIPKAVTTAQKCAMRGESLSYDEIEKNASLHREEHNESALGNIFRILAKGLLIFAGCILLIIGFSGILAVFAAVFGIAVAGLAIPGIFMEALNLAVLSTPVSIILAKVLLALFVFLPFVALLYCGVKLLFKIKTPKWRPGLVMFIVWLLSLIGLVILGVKVSSQFINFGNNISSRFSDSSDWESSELITPGRDTVYIRFSGTEDMSDKKIIAHGDRNEFKLLYIIDMEKDSAFIAVYPSITLNHRDDSVCSVDASCTLFENNMSYEEKKEKEKMHFFSFNNDTLTVDPLYFGVDIPVTEVNRKVTVTVPENFKVIIPEPVFHEFESEFEHFDTKAFDKKALQKIEKKLKHWKVDLHPDEWFSDDENEF